MIDDIERQLESAAKVADAARRVVEDGVGDLKSAQNVKDATRRAKEQGLHINAHGTLSPEQGTLSGAQFRTIRTRWAGTG